MIEVGQQQFIASVFGLLDLTDNTKQLKFDVSGISTGITRTLTAPNANGIIALTDQADGTVKHSNLSDMPSASVSGHDGRYLNLDGEGTNITNGTFSLTTTGNVRADLGFDIRADNVPLCLGGDQNTYIKYTDGSGFGFGITEGTNRIFFEIPTGEFRLEAASFSPATTNTTDIGKADKTFRNAYIDGTLQGSNNSLTIDQASDAYDHSQVAGGDSVHVSTAENTNWDAAYTHSQITGGIHGTNYLVNDANDSSTGSLTTTGFIAHTFGATSGSKFSYKTENIASTFPGVFEVVSDTSNKISGATAGINITTAFTLSDGTIFPGVFINNITAGTADGIEQLYGLYGGCDVDITATLEPVFVFGLDFSVSNKGDFDGGSAKDPTDYRIYGIRVVNNSWQASTVSNKTTAELYGGRLVLNIKGTYNSSETCNAYGVHIKTTNSESGGSGSIDAFGLYIDACATGNAVDNAWGIYEKNGRDNAIVGNVRIGSTSAPTEALDITGNCKISGTLEIGTVQTYIITNVTTVRTFDANATNIDEVADALGTLIADLTTMGILN